MATKVFAVSKSTTVRRNKNNGNTRGQGQAKRWYVGRYGNFDYDAFLKVTTNWDDVGKITDATLTFFTGDGQGDTPVTKTERPELILKRLTGAFDEGNAPDGEWQENDYTNPAKTSTNSVRVKPTRAASNVNNFNVTAIVRAWAPSKVAGGGKHSNHGIGLFGTTDTHENIDLFSEKWGTPSQLPYITLTYEYGPTTPDTPTENMAPTGSVASFADFQGDFYDSKRPTDTLAKSEVQVYDAGVSCTGSASNDRIAKAAHGLSVNDGIYFTSLTGGAGLSAYTGYRVREVIDSGHFTLKSLTTTTLVNITSTLSAGTYSTRLYSKQRLSTLAESVASHFTHVPDSINLLPNTTYRWRVRVTDQEGEVSAWSSLVSFSFQNTAPDAPTLSPISGSSFANADEPTFRGTFTDDDTGDYMGAYEIQMSAYAEGHANWDDATYILWTTGKRYVNGGTLFETPYGGTSLAAGTYYWRARVYDQLHYASAWTYASITFTDSFEQDPDTVVTAIQLRPRAPWRILIKNMLQSDGVTATVGRGPGQVVAILEDAKNVGASELYNSPGELHFTLPKAHPQISVIEPRQTHYAVEFRQGDGWHETFAGLITDFDATDTDIVFYGVDYLGLLDFIVDERYDPSNAEKAAEKGGSKYVTSGKNSINYIIGNSKYGQLALAKNLPNSPVGFITIGTIAAMAETLVVYSTYSPVLQFVVGLIDSHRAGTNKRTRLRVRKKSDNGYEFIVQDDPGVVRDNLRLRYGELVQGYRVVAFGGDWATRIHGIGRAKDGVAVMYDKKTSGLSESTWGRFTQVRMFDGVSDANDLKRRISQAARASSKLGKQIGLGIRSGILQPKDGFEVCDQFPIDIEDGSVSTDAFGSGYWTCVGVTWESSAADGKQNTTISFQPREDTAAPDADLLTLQPISTQERWQSDYEDPDTVSATAKYFLNRATGIVYVRTEGDLVAEDITGTAG